jgi:hypothetical protein
VGLKSLKSLNLTDVYPNNKNNKVKSKPLELFELASKNIKSTQFGCSFLSENGTFSAVVFRLLSQLL